MIDEFERIKIRACQLLNTQDEPNQLKQLALRNLRIAEYLLRETSAFCQYLLFQENDNHKHSIYYIIDCLKKFIIKSIRFYHRLFNPYINKYYEQSKKLISNIDRTTSSNCIKYVLEDNFENYLNEATPIQGKQADQNALSLKIQWTGKINLLVSLFYDLNEKGIIKIPEPKKSINNTKVSKAPNSAETNMNLVEFIYHNFLDSNGELLSKDTLRTYMNPNRPDKRSKRSQDLDIDKYL